jgi:hypothetical protein
MANLEARQLIEDVDILLQKDADTADARQRLAKLREELRHVEETGEWPAGSDDPWRQFAEGESP